MKAAVFDLAEWHDEELVMISMIEHYSYCSRQCALIHLEDIYEENLYTLRGKTVHEKVDEPASEIVDGVRIERALPLWSERLGITGRADVVEFRPDGPYPVEYKSGSRQKRIHEDLQLCGQALCLEEMFGRKIAEGAIYYVKSKKRREVALTPLLRERTKETVVEIRAMLTEKRIPPACNDQRCRNCSLIDSCLPEVIAPGEGNRLRKELRGVFDIQGD